ncbi:adhesion G protein-coupled receptor E3 [Gracilinanus agilis]|uniref:adhesion G protein-coupled receptor E3 n=1 Tax=Gracilinanus agilis TaxID=191870 RepID=UPI001CFD8E0E|nr:adhesion G protein-coupled receptor E3 [Gracilinanus agilis]
MRNLPHGHIIICVSGDRGQGLIPLQQDHELDSVDTVFNEPDQAVKNAGAFSQEEESESASCRPRCPYNADCINGTQCTCKDGFASVSQKKYFNDPLEICEDINENAAPIFVYCGIISDCMNTEGNYHCTCISGYELPSGIKTFLIASINNCQDINECAPPISMSCGLKADCVNTEGSHHCTCISGYELPSGNTTFPNVSLNTCQEASFPNSVPTSGNNPTEKNSLYHLESLIHTNAFWTAKNKTTIGTEVTKLLLDLEQAALKYVVPSPNEDILMVDNQSFLAIKTQVISNCSLKNDNFKLEAQNNSVDIFCMDIIGSEIQDSRTVAFLSYINLGTIINASFFDAKDGDKKNGIYMNSQVVSIAIGPPKSESSPLSVLLKFQHIKKKNAEDASLCVYWQAREREEGSVWSTNGCKLTETNETHTSCNCSHLSSFAVLMAPIPQEEDSVLTMITYVGLSLSLLCLFLAALTFLLCNTIQNTSTSLHLQLSLCLFLADLIFITGIKQTKNKVLCSIIAGLLHYFYLASFTWMLLEGLHLFLTARNLMVVNYTRMTQSLRKVMYPLGYGIPAVIVSISAGSRASLYGTSSRCWLNPEKRFLWAFLGPVCTICCVNLVLILMILWILQNKLSSLSNEVSTLQNTRLLTFKAMAQLCILGCTWCLGILQIGSATWIMAYLFTIINSLQGVFIFLVYCLLNHQVREQYKKWFMTIRQAKYKSESLTLSSKFGTGSTQTHTVRKSPTL